MGGHFMFAASQQPKVGSWCCKQLLHATLLCLSPNAWPLVALGGNTCAVN